MRIYAKVFLAAGVILPIILHGLAPQAMPWWPDTVSMGIAFGAVAVVVLAKTRTDRAINRRLWHALKTLARRYSSP